MHRIFLRYRIKLDWNRNSGE